MSRWLVAVTEPRSEFRAADHLLRQGVESYVPLVRELFREEGRRVWKEGILFPRYLFILTGDQWRFILSTFGIIGVVRKGGSDEPAELPNKIVDFLKRKEVNGAIQIPADPQFRKGQFVKIQQGCFQGYVGVYRSADSLERESVLLNILGRSTPVSVSTGCLVAI